MEQTEKDLKDSRQLLNIKVISYFTNDHNVLKSKTKQKWKYISKFDVCPLVTCHGQISGMAKQKVQDLLRPVSKTG